MPTGNAYPSGHLVPSPIVGLACAPIVETRFLELAMTLLDFSPRMPLGTFSILLFNSKKIQILVFFFIAIHINNRHKPVIDNAMQILFDVIV